ncbi:MAG: hypothetical protein KCHDKBKB_02066 [Elusimicrobia bacterium]|nr:hypothetical protein [Elusimicrobiota bacterium]
MERQYPLPYPHFNALITQFSGLQDPVFISFGFRALAADVAWIQLLQNMGSYGSEAASGKNYPSLKEETLRVTRIDPYFTRAYLFGAATLAWLKATNRPDEAMEILKEGISYNPSYWSFRTVAAGIGYMKTSQLDNMIRMLEDALKDPNCPPTIKSVLANSYKAKKRYADALRIWEAVLQSPQDREYHDRARNEIPLLRESLRHPS